MKNRTILLLGSMVGAGIITYFWLREEQKRNNLQHHEHEIPVAALSEAPPLLLIPPAKDHDQEPSPESKPPTPSSVDPIIIPTESDDSFPLTLGSKGPGVERLQIWLMRNYGLVAPISSVFDQATQRMVQKHLRKDSIGEKTFNQYRMGKHVQQQVIKL